jgi:hypothetical protein
MTISIDQVMDRIPAWSGRSPVVAPLVGGLTNRIYCVDVDGVAYVVRIPGDGTEWLSIDRANELHNTRSAAAARRHRSRQHSTSPTSFTTRNPRPRLGSLRGSSISSPT